MPRHVKSEVTRVRNGVREILTNFHEQYICGFKIISLYILKFFKFPDEKLDKGDKYKVLFWNT